mgnify:CR=1 FL=1
MNLFHKHYVFCGSFCIKPKITSGFQDSKHFYGYHPDHEVLEVCKEIGDTLNRNVRRQELKFVVCDFNSWPSFEQKEEELGEAFWWFFERLDRTSHESIKTQTANILGIKEYRVIKT